MCVCVCACIYGYVCDIKENLVIKIIITVYIAPRKATEAPPCQILLKDSYMIKMNKLENCVAKRSFLLGAL